jgi:methionyl-tRNA formyltransferase
MKTIGPKPWKILFVTQDDPFYVKLFFEEFYEACEFLEEIVGIVIVEPMGKKSRAKLARQMLDFYGPADFLRVGMKYAAMKALAYAPGVFRGNGFTSLQQLSKKKGIRVISGSNINAPDFLKKIDSMDLDLIISVAAPVIFKKELLGVPKHGCINIHNGKLPKYRGMLPNFWQMYNNEKNVGITIHEINPKIDDGRIILQKEVEILPGETLDSLIKRTKREGAHLMIEAISRLKTGNVQYRENRALEGTYFSFPNKKEVQEFKQRGKRIV